MSSLTNRTPSVNPDLMTLKEASRHAGLPVAALLMLCRAGHLRYLRAGLSVWLRREDVKAMSRKGR